MLYPNAVNMDHLYRCQTWRALVTSPSPARQCRQCQLGRGTNYTDQSRASTIPTIYTSYCAGAESLFLYCRIFTLKLDPLSEVILEGHNSQQEGKDIM